VKQVYATAVQDAAVDYRNRGWSAIPIKQRSKAPKLPKGHPFLSRPASEQEFANFDFRHNVGIATGKVSRVIVLDDDDNGETLRERGWHVPATPTVKTRRGHQFYFRWPDGGFPTFDVVPKHLEVRADGAYVVAPPSIHPSGDRYEWVISPDEAELADPPAWLIEQARHCGRRTRAEVVGETISNGSRNKTLFSIAGTLRRRGLDEESIFAALLGINATKCEKPLDEDEVRRIAQSVARYEPTAPIFAPSEPVDSPSPEPAGNRLLAGRVLLGAAIREGIEPPDELIAGVLIRGRTHQFYAGAGQGKTMLLLGLVKEAIERGETVVLFDMENSTRIIGERLEEMGVDPELLDRHLVYLPYPDLPLDAEVVAAYTELLDQLHPSLVAFDSWVNFLASAGLDENHSTDIAAWAVAYLHPARKRNIATAILDHVPYDASHSRGSTRKKDEVDVQWRVVNTQAFHRDSVGEIVLHRQKDREGWLPPSVKFSVGGANNRIIFARSDGTIEAVGEDGLTENASKALDSLRTMPDGEGLTFGQWLRMSGISKTTFRRSVNTLKERGLVRQEGEGGRYFAVEPEGPHDPEDGGSAAPPMALGPHTTRAVAPPEQNSCKTAGPSAEWPQSGPGGPSGRGRVGPPPFKGGPSGPASVAPSTNELTGDQRRRIRKLIREGMSEKLACEEVLGKGWVEP
jgi:Bifunctional DNA primase/polymerase, N-terminal/Primase C terminal 1 (PriCT-1)/AAA domain